MVTTRRGSHGIHEGDALALRSKDTPDTPELSSGRRLRDGKIHEPSPIPSRKRKLNGNDVPDAAPTKEARNGNTSSTDPEAGLPDPTEAPQNAVDTAAIESSNELLNDFISFPEEITSESFPPGKGQLSKRPAKLPQRQSKNNSKRFDTASTTAATSRTAAGNQDVVAVLPVEDANVVNGELASSEAPMSNSHKRFDSEEPLIAEEGSLIVQEELGIPVAQTTKDAEDRESSSDEEAPEVFGTKSAAKDTRPLIKAPKPQKTKSKPSTVTEVSQKTEPEAAVDDYPLLSEQTADADTDAPAAVPLYVPEPQSILLKFSATTVTSKKRKIFDGTAKAPKDLVQDGVIYRPFLEDQPTVTVTKKHMFQLPPKQGASRRQKEQMLVRKRVQHIWGGRTAFLRS